MAEKKGATIFDFINGMTYQKKEWSEYTETDHKKFSSFIVNRWLSMKMELIDIVNELQKYTIGLLSARETYRLYHGFLPAQRTFAKYIKGKKEGKFDIQLVSLVADHYKVSKSESTDYVELMSKESCADLLGLYGYTEKEKKKLLKGKKSN